MYLIAGLGNPEKDYAGTRHNIGFEVIKKLAHDNDIKINKLKSRAFIGEGSIYGKRVILAMPQTYMNLSGESIRELILFYKLELSDLIVIYDDTALPVGQIRLREKGSAGGHNGIKNLLFHLESDEFLRVKVGIGEKPPGWDLADYVTSRFKKTEQDDIMSSVEDAVMATELVLKEGVFSAMNRFNQKITAEPVDAPKPDGVNDEK